MEEIKKVIIPAAGRGTRFLPYTKAIAKELLPLINKPAIHYIAQECMLSALKQIVMVTNKDKYAIGDYFGGVDHYQEQLNIPIKHHLLAELEKLIRNLNFTYVHQPEPLGLGHAVLSARHAIHQKEYFCVILPDDLIVHETPGIQQLMQIARQEKASVIAVQEVPLESVSSYGIIGIKKQISPSLFQVNSLVEKPKPSAAPSNLAIVGRYVLSWKIFQALDEVGELHSGGELQLTDGIARMLFHNERVFAYKIQGERHDIGTPMGWIQAIIKLGLQDPQLAPQLRAFLQNLDAAYLPLNAYSPASTIVSR